MSLLIRSSTLQVDLYNVQVTTPRSVYDSAPRRTYDFGKPDMFAKIHMIVVSYHHAILTSAVNASGANQVSAVSEWTASQISQDEITRGYVIKLADWMTRSIQLPAASLVHSNHNHHTLFTL